jgi:hypothetical protein
MKENGEKQLSQKERDDALMNFVSRQAQEAILDPHLPGSYKDKLVSAAAATISRIAERRTPYHAVQNESQEPKESGTIYEAK